MSDLLVVIEFLQKFQRRTSVVNKGEMEKYWQYLSITYVTEESDDPDNPNGLVEHKIEWRSDSKCKHESGSECMLVLTSVCVYVRTSFVFIHELILLSLAP